MSRNLMDGDIVTPTREIRYYNGHYRSMSPGKQCVVVDVEDNSYGGDDYFKIRLVRGIHKSTWLCENDVELISEHLSVSKEELFNMF